MTPLKYDIKRRCAQNITTFYRNVSKKYKHTYSLELMEQNVRDAYAAMFQIERTLLRREPILSMWKEKGYHMANTDRWYYAYTFDGENTAKSDIDILLDFSAGAETYPNFLSACQILEESFKRTKVDVVTKKGLSPYIGQSILREVEYV